MRRLTPRDILYIALLVFIPLLSSYADAKTSKAFLWKVRAGQGTVYLLGSIHLMKPDAYPLDARIESAFEKSEVLAVEANIAGTGGKIDLAKILDQALYPATDGLKNHVSEETYDLVRNESAESGLPLELLTRQRPWFLALTLQSLALVRRGYEPGLGIDMHFIEKAEGKKKIVELESVDFQIGLLSGLSDGEQEQFLVYTLREMGSLAGMADRIMEAWKTGDAAAMDRLINGSLTDEEKRSPLMEKFFYSRNRSMADKIKGYLRTGGTYFVVVGAGHLVGEKGISGILKAEGYRVEQL